jgi:hypothetical protein
LFLLGVAFVDCSDGGRNGRFRHHRRFHHWADLVETAVSKLLSCGVGLVDFSGGGWKRPFSLQDFHLSKESMMHMGHRKCFKMITELYGKGIKESNRLLNIKGRAAFIASAVDAKFIFCKHLITIYTYV